MLSGILIELAPSNVIAPSPPVMFNTLPTVEFIELVVCPDINPSPLPTCNLVVADNVPFITVLPVTTNLPSKFVSPVTVILPKVKFCCTAEFPP